MMATRIIYTICMEPKALVMHKFTWMEKVTMKNGKPAMKAKCPDCGTGMYKIGNS